MATGRVRLTLIVLGAIAVLTLPFALGPVLTALVITMLLFAVFSTAFNLLYGYTGLLSFGHAMFVATAAYVTAKVYRLIGPALGFDQLFGGASVLATFVFGILLGVVFATLLAVVVGYLSVQLEEIYFAMLTLSFSMAIWAVFQKNVSGQLGEIVGLGALLGTNGSDGLTIPFDAVGTVNLFGLQFQLVDISNYNTYYVIVLLVCAASMYALWRIVQSPFGTTCKAIRENPERARALGINTTYHSWMTFIVSGAFSGLVGTMYAPMQSNVNPGFAHWTFSAEPVIMTVIGGPYSFIGPLVGAVFYEYLRYFISQFGVLEAHWQFVFGTILLAVVLFFDNGIAGGLKRFRAWVGTASARYDEAGVGGVAGLARETVVGWGAAFRAAASARLVALRRAVADRLSGESESTPTKPGSDD